MAPLVVPHAPSDRCGEDHCYSCNVDEPIRRGERPYLVCGECGHVFRTASALRRLSRRNRMGIQWHQLRHGGILPPRGDPAWDLLPADLRPRWPRLTLLWALPSSLFPRASRVTFCPLCSHDF